MDHIQKSKPKLHCLSLERKPQPGPKRGDLARRELISFFFRSAGYVYCKILSDVTPVSSTVFCEQLREMASRPAPWQVPDRHGYRLTSHPKKAGGELKKLGIIWPPHPSYSPDLSPSDYHAS